MGSNSLFTFMDGFLQEVPGTEQFTDANRQVLNSSGEQEGGQSSPEGGGQHGMHRPENLKGGLVRQHLYEIEIGKWAGDKLVVTNCEVTSIPASSLSTNPLRIYGPITEMPYEKLFSGDLSVTFRLDKGFGLRKSFIKWQKEIFDEETGDFGYYEDYTTTLKVTQFDGEGEELYKIELDGVYPKTVGPIELGFAQNDTYSKQTIDFAYRQWKEI